MRKTFYSVVFLLALSACTTNNAGRTESAKEEISKTEKAFEAAVKTKGLAEAFSFYADEHATIKRQNDTMISGKENIRSYYENPWYKKASVSWSPDFIDVSSDGTLGYTYGKYLWQMPDSSGNMTEHRGVFHTVWKKQEDGTWRYVWD
jgi:ketosteroid isomerase-like protein